MQTRRQYCVTKRIHPAVNRYEMSYCLEGPLTSPERERMGETAACGEQTKSVPPEIATMVLTTVLVLHAMRSAEPLAP